VGRRLESNADVRYAHGDGSRRIGRPRALRARCTRWIPQEWWAFLRRSHVLVDGLCRRQRSFQPCLCFRTGGCRSHDGGFPQQRPAKRARRPANACRSNSGGFAVAVDYRADWRFHHRKRRCIWRGSATPVVEEPHRRGVRHPYALGSQSHAYAKRFRWSDSDNSLCRRGLCSLRGHLFPAQSSSRRAGNTP